MNSIFGLTGSFEINFVLAIFKVHDSYTHCQHQHNHSQDPTIAHTHCIPCIRTYFNTLLPSSLLFSPPSPSSHYEPIMSPLLLPLAVPFFSSTHLHHSQLPLFIPILIWLCTCRTHSNTLYCLLHSSLFSYSCLVPIHLLALYTHTPVKHQKHYCILWCRLLQ